MKILFISSWYPTPQNPGLGIFIKEHAKAIKTTQHELRVLAVVVVRDEPYLKVTHREYVDDSGIRTFEIILKSRIRDVIYHCVPLQQFIAFRYYRQQIEPYFKPEIIHSNVVFPAGMIGDYFARKLKIPHIITEHWSKLAGLLKKPYLATLAVKAYKRSSVILPVSEFLKSNIIGLIPELENHSFKVVPNVISPEVFDYREKTRSSDTIRFCAVATWATKRNPDKQPELFIKALSEVQRQIDQKIHLTMVGNGDRVPALKQLCADLGVSADFVGYKTKPQIAEILYQSDFFLHASTIETFGVVVVEALMTGTPVVCSAVGALPELINERNGVLCENTEEAWRGAINDVLNKKYFSSKFSEDVKNKYSYFQIGAEVNIVYKKASE